MKLVLVKPKISEKSAGLIKQNQYTFVVGTDINKNEVAEFVEKTYKVDVQKVNTLIVKGKKRVRGRTSGYMQKYKKAIVQLKEGQVIEEIKGAA